jgi:anti-sigma factor RsiW
MKHVTDRLAAWAGGALTAVERQEVDRHLDACPGCRGEADQLRETWDALGLAALPPDPHRADLWPAVRERTFGRSASGWFFGPSPVVRLSLAVATLAVGVLCGRLGGDLAGARTAVAADDSGLAAVWIEDSTWHDASGGGLADSWLALADTGELQGTAAGQGGSK